MTKFRYTTDGAAWTYFEGSLPKNLATLAATDSVIVQPLGDQVINQGVAPTYAYRTELTGDANALAVWALDETSGTTFTDLIGSRVATISGSVTVNQTGLAVGDSAKSASFGGGYAAMAASDATLNFAYNQAFTVEALVYLTASPSEQFIVSKQKNSGTYQGWSFGITNQGGNLLQFSLAASTSAQIYVRAADNALSLNTLYRVKVSYDGSGLAAGVRMWVNGKPCLNLTVVDNLAGGTTTTTLPVQIAAREGALPLSGRLQYLSIKSGATNASYPTTARGYDVDDAFRYSLALGRTSVIADYIRPDVIIDTDMCIDVDDAFDVHTMCYLHVQGRINIIGAVISASNDYSAPCAEAIMRWWGINAPVYAYQSNDLPTTSSFAQQVATRFNPGKTRVDYVDDLTGYRRLLAANSRVVIMQCGTFKPLVRLLQSAANAGGDGYPSGADLITANVKAMVFVSGFGGGRSGLSTTTEYNLASDPAAASTIASSWPGDIVQCGIELAEPTYGDIATAALKTKPPSGSDPLTNPVKYAMDLFAAANPSQVDASGKRTFYALPGILWAAYGIKGNYVRWGGIGGTESINSSSGVDSWSPSPTSKWHYLRKKATDASMNTLADTMLAAAP